MPATLYQRHAVPRGVSHFNFKANAYYANMNMLYHAVAAIFISLNLPCSITRWQPPLFNCFTSTAAAKIILKREYLCVNAAESSACQ
jgi:hypothetical protein